jgi:hypothetical protein
MKTIYYYNTIAAIILQEDSIMLCLYLEVPKCEIFDCLDFHDFYTNRPFCVGDFGAKISINYLYFWGRYASLISYVHGDW